MVAAWRWMAAWPLSAVVVRCGVSKDSWIPSTTGSSLLSSCLSSVALPLVCDDDEFVAELMFVMLLMLTV